MFYLLYADKFIVCCRFQSCQYWLQIFSCSSIANPRMMTTVVQWTVEDVAAWLEQCLHLPYAEEFVQAGFSWGEEVSYNFLFSYL